MASSIMVICAKVLKSSNFKMFLCNYQAIGLMSRVFANGLGDWSSHSQDSKNGT